MINDQLDDDRLLSAMRVSLTGVRDSLTGVHLDRPVEAITGRARSRRLRRGLYGGAAAGMALAASLTVALATSPAPPVHVNLAAWSVDTTPTGQVELTIRELTNQPLLEQTLARAGVPAVVDFGQFCRATTRADIVTGPSASHFLGHLVTSGRALLAVTINPAAIPPGTTVDLGVIDVGSGHGFFEVEIIKKGASLTCHPIKAESTEPPAAS